MTNYEGISKKVRLVVANCHNKPLLGRDLMKMFSLNIAGVNYLGILITWEYKSLY